MCRCCNKEGKFCRCVSTICQRCESCILHCECAKPKSPTLDKPVGDRGTCKGCGATIWWVITPKGKKMPQDATGGPHWATCPKAKDFKKAKL